MANTSMIYEYIVIAAYFMLLLAIGFTFKNMASKSTSDYFRGGGRMLWWMVGSTAFMMQFSAWTFTGAAGKAFTDGFAVCLVFIANTFSYFCGWLYFAKRFRQMRVDTPTEAIRGRFGPQNERFFSWALIIFTLMNAGIWLNALGVFATAVFDTDISLTIIVTGLTVVFVSVLSGAWGVVASDFMQTLVVAVISIACAIVALVKVGGPMALVTEFPSDFIVGPNMNYPLLLVGTFVFFLAKQLVTIMNLHDSFRFLTAKDSINAKKAAFLAMCLMGFGSFIWFIPPWASAILYPDAGSAFSQLGSKAADAIYLVFTRNTMPAGTVGLMLAGLFAASMSSMDSALNKNTGIMIRSLYQPFLAKRGRATNDRKLVKISMGLSLASGIIVIAMALFFKSLKELSLFDLMMSLSAMIQVPLLIPLILGIFIKKTPQWAPWATVILGLFMSWLMKYHITPDVFAQWIGIDGFTKREAADMSLILTLGSHVFITATFFCATSLFYKKEKDQNKEETHRFFINLEKPVIADTLQNQYDKDQRTKLGAMVICMGIGIMLMALIPNPLWGRAIFIACSLVITSIGLLLRRNTKQLS